MIEAKLGSMEQKTRRGKRLASPPDEITDVDSFADQRMSALREVNPDLVGASGLEPDLAESRQEKALEDLHLRNGLFSLLRSRRRRSAQPIAAIGEEAAFETAALHSPVREAEIDARDGSCAELLLEGSFGGATPCVDQETRGILVQAMDDMEHSGRGREAAALPLGADLVHQCSPLPAGVGNARDARGFLGDHQMAVLVEDRTKGRLRGSARGTRVDPYGLSRGHPLHRVRGASALDGDPALGDEASRRGPGEPGMTPPQDRGEGETFLVGRNLERSVRTRTRSR
jgi:hypothetical protein